MTSPQVRERRLGFERTRRVEAMRLSLIEMFGERALSVAKGQQGRHDVGAESGICWHDLFEALSRNAC